tara:strand:+ start:282 stop:1391 length:1110 start_codon:yes stop_codon:yes gene_type:complete
MYIYIRQSLSIPEEKNDKHWREFLFAESMQKSFDNTLLIGSDFNHYKKKHYSNIFKDFSFKLKLIKTLGYSSNSSFFRVLDAWFFSFKLFFYILFKTPMRSTVICSFPTPESALLSSFACILKRNRFILDFRDAWPEALPKKNKLLNIIFNIYIKLILFLIRPLAESTIYMSGKMQDYYSLDIRSYIIPNWFSAQKQNNIPVQPNIVFAGTISSQFDFSLLVKLSKIDCFVNFTFDVYGDGPLFDFYSDMFQKFDNVVFHGKISYEKLMCIFQSCSMFFIPYSNPSLFENHLNNKIIEMVAFNKPILTNLNTSIFSFGDTKLEIGLNFSEIEEYSKNQLLDTLKIFDNNADNLFSKDAFDLQLKEFLNC